MPGYSLRNKLTILKERGALMVLAYQGRVEAWNCLDSLPERIVTGEISIPETRSVRKTIPYRISKPNRRGGKMPGRKRGN